MSKRDDDDAVFEVKRQSRAERARRFKASLISDVESETDDVRDFVARASRRYLDRFDS